MPEVVRAIVPDARGNILMVQERKPSAYGLWTFPGGSPLEGEDPTQAVKRETYEETDYAIELVTDEPVHELILPNGWLYKAYLGQVTGGQLAVQRDELLDARWLSTSQIQRLGKMGKLRDAVITESIVRAKEHARLRH